MTDLSLFFSSKQAQEHLKQLRSVTSALMDSATQYVLEKAGAIAALCLWPQMCSTHVRP